MKRKRIPDSKRELAGRFIKTLIAMHKLNKDLDVTVFIRAYRDYLSDKKGEYVAIYGERNI